MVLDVILQARRNQDAAEALLGRLVEGQPTEPWVIVTDKLASYVPAIKKVFPQAEHRAHKCMNNRAENSHQPTRQRFLEPFGPIRQHFSPGRHLLPAPDYRAIMAERRATWDELSGVAV
jgi:putative transposase